MDSPLKDRIVGENDPFDVGLRKDVAREAMLRGLPRAILQQIVPADALVENPHGEP